MPINTLLVDDEHFALALLENFIGRVPDLTLVGACRSPVRAIELLQREAVDLLFLDIQMPLLSGTNLLRGLSRRPVTIFTTAYAQYAPEAFELDAVDYLMKPYSFERFEHAVGKARELLAARLGAAASRPEGALTVKVDRAWVRLALADIVYIEGWKEYVKIFTAGGEKVITLESLSHLEEILPREHFLRVHKSYIVARGRVEKLAGDALVLAGGGRVPVARARKKEVIEAMFGAG